MLIDPKRFSQELIYRDTNSPLAIAQSLQKIGEVDLYFETQKKKFQSLTLIISSLCLTSFIVLVLGGIVFGLPAFIFTLILTIYFAVKLSKYGKLDIPNFRHELPQRILTMLDRDINREIPVTIAADFRSPIDKSKKISSRPHPYRSGLEIQEYKNLWFNLTGELLDKSQFQLNIIDFNRVTSGWVRSSSGKNKYKSKTKYRGTEINVSLKYSQRKYGAIQLLKQNVLEAIQLPGDVSIKRLKVTDKFLFLSALSRSQASNKLYEITVSIFLSLYQVLNLARVLSKRK